MPRLHVHRLFAALLASLLILAGGAAQAQARAGSPVMLNFANAEIEDVARAMGALAGRNIVVDPRVKGQVNLLSERAVSVATALDQFAAELRVRGFALVDAEGMYRIVPEADAKLQGSTVVDGSTPPRGPQVVTQVFRLSHENANNLVPVLRPLISPNNTINVSPGANALVITDYADNLRRLARIIEAMDGPGSSDMEVVPLRHALAADLAPLVQRLLDGEAVAATTGGSGGNAAANAALRSLVLAEPRSNALIVRAATPARTMLARSLIGKLDLSSSAEASGNIHVVYLKNAEASKLAETLRAVISGSNTASTSSATATAATLPAGTVRTAATPATSSTGATGGQIQADAATNSLIISAPEPLYRQLRAVIDQLDTRRAQVFVESLIAEVNADVASEFGIQWQGGSLNNATGAVVGLMGTNFGNGAGNIFNVANQAAAGQPVAPGTGLNIGVGQRNRNGVALGLLARFLEQNGAGNVLSTPNLMTLDNEEAKIVIGQNVPLVTGQYTNNNTGGGAVNPFQTIERRDVGLTLRVKPQVSENGTVRMSIAQEVSSVLPSSLNSPTGLITSKRSIETNVLVDDGSIIVLGGLLQDESATNNEKVPGVSSIPIFGALFRSESKSRQKTNLMVFLRPVVVRTAQDSDRLSFDRYELMRAAQQNAPELPDIRKNGVLPEIRPAEPGTGTPAAETPAAAATPVSAPVAAPAEAN